MGKFFLGTFAFLISLTALTANAGCQFSWHNYGDNSIRDLVSQDIGKHVSDDYCRKYNQGHEIVILFDAFTLRDMCVGYSTASIRKKGTKNQQARRFNSVASNTDCRTTDEARRLAANASISALDDLMANLADYKVE